MDGRLPPGGFDPEMKRPPEDRDEYMAGLAAGTFEPTNAEVMLAVLTLGRRLDELTKALREVANDVS